MRRTRLGHPAARGSDRAAVAALALVTFALSTVGWLTVWALAPMVVGWQPYSIVSGSMAPDILPGDVVVVDPRGVELVPGAVVTFADPSHPDRVLTHRLVGRNPDGTWRTRGDANTTADHGALPPSAVLGRPRLLVPWVGLPAYWRATGQVLPLVATVVLLVVSARAAVVLHRATSVTPAAGPPPADPPGPPPRPPVPERDRLPTQRAHRDPAPAP